MKLAMGRLGSDSPMRALRVTAPPVKSMEIVTQSSRVLPVKSRSRSEGIGVAEVPATLSPHAGLHEEPCQRITIAPKSHSHCSNQTDTLFVRSGN